MYEQIDFEMTQLQFLESAMGQPALAGFKPDNKTLAQVTALRTDAQALKVSLADALTTWQAARGATAGDCGACLGISVQLYGSMRSLYRNVPDALMNLRRIPKRRTSPKSVLNRMTVTAWTWQKLPNQPGTSLPYQLGALTLATYEGMVTTFEGKVAAEVDAKSTFLTTQDALRRMVRSLRSFMGAAIAQGKALYPEGTEARAWIDAIPTEGNTPVPSQAVVNVATSPSNGAVHLEFTSAHATSFQVWHKGPGETVFTQVGESPVPGVYDATGLAAGEHAYQIVGVNSRGEGEASLPSTVAVAGELPGAAGIFSAESPSAGAVHLYYGADGATSYQVWHKGPGESSFTQVDTTLTGEYVAFDLPGGMHAYKVVGVNVVGAGAASAPSTVDVGAEAVA